MPREHCKPSAMRVFFLAAIAASNHVRLPCDDVFGPVLRCHMITREKRRRKLTVHLFVSAMGNGARFYEFFQNMTLVDIRFFVLLSILFSGYVFAFCPENEISLCKNELVRLKTSESVHLPITEETLKDLCRMEKDAIDCVDDYALRCLTNSSFKIYQFLTNGSRRVFEALCSEDSQIRDDYLKHAKCLRPIRGEVVYCVEHRERFLGNVNFETLGEDIQKTCCVYFERVKCASETARKHCGEAAAHFMEDLLSEPEGTPLSEKCSMKYSTCRETEPSHFVNSYSVAHISDSSSGLLNSCSVALNIMLGLVLFLKNII